MARTNIPITELPFSGITQLSWTAGDATNDHVFINDGNTIIIVKNGGGGAVQVTVVEQPEPLLGRSSATGTQLSVDAGEEAVIGPLAAAGYNIKSGDDVGKVYIDLDVDASVELVACRLRRA